MVLIGVYSDSLYDTFRLIPFYNNKSDIKSEVSHTARHLDRPCFSSDRPKLNHWFGVPYLKLIPRHFYKGIFPRFCKYIIGSIIHYWWLAILFFKKNFFFQRLFIFETERDREWTGEGQRERETQNPKQALGSELSAQSLMRVLNSWTVRSWPESKSATQPTQPPRRPASCFLNNHHKTV